MSITRINQFQAKAGQGDNLRELIKSFLPMINSSEGCQSSQLLQSQDDPTKIVVIEVWDSVEAHQTSVKNIPTEVMQQAMKLLASPPKGGYYQTVI